QQKQALLDRMIDLKLETVLAAKKNLKVSKDDISREMTNLYSQTGNSEDEIKKLLSDVYGWTPEQFTVAVLAPQILENKLQKSLVEDREANKDAYTLAQQIKDELGVGGDFAALAKQYSADTTTKDNGGDLGWATKGMLVPEFENAIFSMQPDQISDIIPSQYGLHIIQVLETGKNDAGEPQVHARHILVSTRDFTQWLADQRTKAVIWKFAPI
ncbi:MAG: peptidyl-prolyl cis-trans isomerase, partial [Patescibacteria group bacterium]|nr:peptidyl-prolyl cis-trans isomerase [Patescibacteria group bacterium]